MNQRIVGYDLARCLAIFGMVVVNFRIAMAPEADGQEWLVTLASLLDGRAAATFVILAGVGLSLMSRAARETGDASKLRQVRSTLFRRSLFLFVVGLSFSPVWSADILHYYGVYIAIAACLLDASNRRLGILAAGLIPLFFMLLILLDYEQNWDWNTLHYSSFWTTDGFLLNLFYNGFHPVVPWLSFMLFGMILGRLDLGDKAVRWRVGLTGAGVATAAETLSRLLTGALVSDPQEQADLVALLGTEPMPPMPLYMLAAAGTSSCIIALCVGIGQKMQASALIRSLVATGQLALTIYVAHVILGLGLVEAAGRMTGQTIVFSVGCALAFCIVSVLFSHLWRRRFARGPLELLMRRLT